MMRRTLFCLSLATTLGTGCATMVEQPSESAALQSGIVGGQAEHAYPAVGALMDGQGLCTGTIFQGRWSSRPRTASPTTRRGSSSTWATT